MFRLLFCSFCRRRDSQVAKLVAGPRIFFVGPACLYLRRLRCSLRKHHGKGLVVNHSCSSVTTSRRGGRSSSPGIEASRMGGPSIETEHLLLGLIREPRGPRGDCF